MGVHDPSDIQRVAMPQIVEGRTLAIQSYTGSGKVRAHVHRAQNTLCTWHGRARPPLPAHASRKGGSHDVSD